ncbi:MAG: hypothetical protein HQL63_07195 [Magnetococcales bacterium]|nr:hypothetical protein [Magnetococcales bacterium]
MAARPLFYVLITLLTVGWLTQGVLVAEERWPHSQAEMAEPGDGRGGSGDDRLGRRFGRFMGSFMEEMDKKGGEESDTGRYGRGRSDQDAGYGGHRQDDYSRKRGYDELPPRFRAGESARYDDDRGYLERRSRRDVRGRGEAEPEGRHYRDAAPVYDPWDAAVPYGYPERPRHGYEYGSYPDYDPWGAYAPYEFYGPGYGRGWGQPDFGPEGRVWGGGPWGGAADPLSRDPWWRGEGRPYFRNGFWQDPFVGTPWGWGGGSWFW